MNIAVAEKFKELRGGEVTVDRARWNAKRMTRMLGSSRLYNGIRGDYCCWGFVGMECGFIPRDIDDKGYLSDLLGPIDAGYIPWEDLNLPDRFKKELVRSMETTLNNTPEKWIAKIQDMQRVPVETKEEAVKHLFKHYYDITINFVGEFPEEEEA